MEPTRISKEITTTWCGGRATQFELHFDRSRHGKRVVIMNWLDKDLLTISAIKGDGRTANFRELTKIETCPRGDWRREAARIARSLADEHFASIAMKLNQAMLEALQAEYAKIERIDPLMPAYAKLTALLDRADRNTLLQLSLANIKFVSHLANNRLRRQAVPTVNRRYPVIRSKW